MARNPIEEQIIEISSSISITHSSSASNSSINYEGSPETEIEHYASSINLASDVNVQQLKVICRNTCDVKESKVLAIHEMLEKKCAHYDIFTGFYTFLREMHADEYYQQGNASFVRRAFQDYLNRT